MAKFSSFFGKKSAKIHTNGLAHVASNSTVGGSTSPESFATRKHIAKNRRTIQGFTRSAVATGYRAHALGTLQNNRTAQQAARNQRFGTEPGANARGTYSARSSTGPVTRTNISGISTRRYDPYR